MDTRIIIKNNAELVMSADDLTTDKVPSTALKVKGSWSKDEAELLQEFRERDRLLAKESDELAKRGKGFEKLLVWVGSLSLGVMVGVLVVLFMSGGVH